MDIALQDGGALAHGKAFAGSISGLDPAPRGQPEDGLAFLRAPASQVFNDRQLRALACFLPPAVTPPASPLPTSLYLILKATRLCNLRCSYCHAWREGRNQVLSFELLLDVIAQAMTLPGVKRLHIVWHGGETTLLSRKYFQRAIWLQEYFRIDDRKVGHAIQTNATRVDDVWASFFKAAGFSVGVSLDLDAEQHDRNRRFPDGRGSYAQTLAGLEALRRFGVPHGLLAVVDEQVIDAGAERLLERLASQQIHDVGLLNALPPNDGGSPQPYLPWTRYTNFLREVFAAWYGHYDSLISIRELSSLLSVVRGAGNRLCIYQGGCMGQYLTIEPDGRVSACDKYVGDPTHLFGRLSQSSLQTMLTSGEELIQARKGADDLLGGFKVCANYAYCRGGCPHDARLNRMHGSTEACCGLDGLIQDMKTRVDKEKAHGSHFDRP